MQKVTASDRNPNEAGRKGQDFISYLKAFLLAPVSRVEQNSEAIAAIGMSKGSISIITLSDWDVRGHILKFMNLMHIVANVTGTYGV